ncbi:hypothetical protein OROMI_009183 [Orobanche minor]
MASSTADEHDSSSDESMTVTKWLLDEEEEYDGIVSSNMKNNWVQTVSINVQALVSTVFMNRKRPHGGSLPGRRYIKRDRQGRHKLNINDYFKGEETKYTPEQFRRRFRMDVELFNRILHAIQDHDSYFTPKIDAVGRPGINPLQKMVAAIRMPAYGCAADQLDEYVQIGESMAIESLQHFCAAVINIFEDVYLRRPNDRDVDRLLEEGEERGFPGMLGSLDCMHWPWKNCPTAWHGVFVNGFKRTPTLILEAVASKNLWIWHAFFGMAGTNNDITVLNRSPLFDDLVNGIAPPCPFVVNGHRYDMGYYLSDGIYPPYATLIQSISSPSTEKETTFAKNQEAIRKDVERAFAGLQSRWHIVKGPARMWSIKDLGKIMKTCIILHNMIIESETRKGIDPENWSPHMEEKAEKLPIERDPSVIVSKLIKRLKEVHSRSLHKDLKADLIDHLWNRQGAAKHS